MKKIFCVKMQSKQILYFEVEAETKKEAIVMAEFIADSANPSDAEDPTFEELDCYFLRYEE